MKRVVLGALTLVLAVFLIGCGGKVKKEVAVLDTTKGEVILGFYAEEAPKGALNHVENFKRLAREGVYDGVLFHRVIPGFVAQTGDPGTKDASTPREMYGTGGTGNSVALEINDNSHKRGALGMARSMDPNSADSQFYICLNDIPHLDGNYTVFGEVLKGMEVVDEISKMPTDARDCPIEDVRINSVKIVSEKEAGLE